MLPQALCLMASIVPFFFKVFCCFCYSIVAILLSRGTVWLARYFLSDWSLSLTGKLRNFSYAKWQFLSKLYHVGMLTLISPNTDKTLLCMLLHLTVLQVIHLSSPTPHQSVCIIYNYLCLLLFFTINWNTSCVLLFWHTPVP